jgi:hypothetical protein
MEQTDGMNQRDRLERLDFPVPEPSRSTWFETMPVRLELCTISIIEEGFGKGARSPAAQCGA